MKDLINREKVAIDQDVENTLLTRMKMPNVVNNDQLDKSIYSLDVVDALSYIYFFCRSRNSSNIIHYNFLQSPLLLL